MLRIFHENFVCICFLKAGFFPAKNKTPHEKKKKMSAVPGHSREHLKGQQLPWDGLCRFSTGGPDRGDTAGSRCLPGKVGRT